MDQIPSAVIDDVNNECSLQNNAPVNPSEGNIFENSSNLVSNEIAIGCSNNQNESSENTSDSLLETKNRTDENDISSTSYVENEIISNENDAIVDQHSTCETFEKEDSSSCKEMEVDSSEQPNIDNISADSMVNNILPPASPSPSDRIELLPTSDHTELLSASDRIKLPAVSDPIELPSPSDHIELPPTSDHTELLSASDRIKLSAVSDPIDLPSSSDHIELPPASDSTELLSASDRIKLPAVSDHIDLPSPSDHIELPPASDHTELLSESDRIKLPVGSDRIDPPSPEYIQRSPASDHITQPSPRDQIELPAVSDDTDLPSPSDLIQRSSASDYIEPPSPRDCIELPSASDCTELSSVANRINLSSPSDCSHISLLPCAVANSNTVCSPDTTSIANTETNPICEAVSNAEVRLNTEDASIAESSCNTEAVTNAEFSANTAAVTNAETNPISKAVSYAEDISIAESSCNTEVVTYAKSSANNAALTNAETNPISKAVSYAEARLNAEDVSIAGSSVKVVTYAESSANNAAVTNAETDHVSEAVSYAKAKLNAEDVAIAGSRCNLEVVTYAESSANIAAVTNAETNADTEVATNSVTTPAADIFNTEASPNMKVVTNVEVSADSEVVSNAETSLTTEDVTNPEASPDTKIVTNAEAVSNPDSSLPPNENAGDASKLQNICDSPSKDTNPVNEETLDRVNNFLPTIVAIQGGCTDVLEKTSDPSSSNSLHGDVSSSKPEMPTLNIVSVLGGCKDINADNEISKTNVENDCPKPSNPIIRTISHSEETDILNNHTVEDPEVICIETTAEIPPPIPIKMESNIEGLNVEAESRSVNKNGKFTAKKRLTRSSLSQSEDCIFLSSGSDADGVSDAKNRGRSSKKAPYSRAGYTCHLCNTVFQEHELLNEHMILHRNNSLIEAKVQNRWKATKAKPYACDICQKQLSTSQSLQQHVLIHKNEKPFVCAICKKDFRHLQTYRMHQQKHKAQRQCPSKTPQTVVKEQLDKSMVRGADFGRLVGPLFMKESLWHQEKDTSSSKSPSPVASLPDKKTVFGYYTKGSVSPLPHLSFDQSPFKPTPSAASPVIIRRREPSPESRSEDECVAVKSFSNIESVVMNAAKIIVKLDNLDTRVLKRKLQTPDICIDQAPKKCRVMLSPIAEKCKVKLDEIENIPMDVDVGDGLPAAEPMDNHEDYPNEGNKETADSSVCPTPTPSTLTSNEVVDLSSDSVSTDTSAHGSNGRSQILKHDLCKTNDSIRDSFKTAASPPPKQSNVIFVEAPPTHEMCTYDEETDNRLDDAFDAAFQKVAVRRLALLQKRAAENGGKVESRYLLGPLFWRKALRRAQKQTADADVVADVDVALSNSKNGTRATALRMRASQFGGRSKFDNRRTNDPTKLQLRAERKFKYLLELAKMLDNLNSLNLAGPLFWRRTLRLAGIHRGEDLRTHVNIISPTLDGVEFVDDGGQLCDIDDDAPVGTEKTSSRPSDPAHPSLSDRVQPSLSNQVQSSLSDQVEASTSNPVQPLPPDSVQPSPLPCVQPSASEVPATCSPVSEPDGQQSGDQLAAGGVPKLADKMQVPRTHPAPSCLVAADNTSNEVASLKTDSILYESLTKQKEKQQPSNVPEGVPPSYLDSTSLFVASQGTAVEPSLASHSRTEVVEEGANEQSNQCLEPSGEVTADQGVGKLAAIDAGNIVLNVDTGGGLQLIPASDQIPIAGAGQNFVLLSDGNGTMQYMVNVPHDNFGNFELIGNAAGADQVAYAIQFNGENYAAVQFVQDGGIQLQSDRGLKEAQMLVDPKAATYLVSDAGATAAVADPSHIGRELSDFLNLDYDNLLKNGNANQPVS